MTSANQSFQILLTEHNLSLQLTNENQFYTYRGKLSIAEDHVLEFAISISEIEEDSFSVAQILFNNIAYLDEAMSREEWLSLLNEVTIYHGLYFYFAPDENNQVFGRYITKVSSKDVESFLKVFLEGTRIMKNVIQVIEKATINE